MSFMPTRENFRNPDSGLRAAFKAFGWIAAILLVALIVEPPAIYVFGHFIWPVIEPAFGPVLRLVRWWWDW